MDYERGLQLLEQSLNPTDLTSRNDLDLYKAGLLENLNNERRYGSDPMTSSTRARLVDSLNVLSRRVTGMSFTDLCSGKQPTPQVFSGSVARSMDKDVVETKKRRLQQLEKQQAVTGYNTRAEIVLEIEDLRRELGL